MDALFGMNVTGGDLSTLHGGEEEESGGVPPHQSSDFDMLHGEEEEVEDLRHPSTEHHHHHHRKGETSVPPLVHHPHPQATHVHHSGHDESALHELRVVRRTKKQYICEFEGCSKEFKQKCNLDVHRRIHTGEKPFECKQCGEKFNQISTLRGHERIHTGERPYKCRQGCDRTFSVIASRTTHERIAHTLQKPYKCPECHHAFFLAGDLTKHRRKHTGEKPYFCGIDGCTRNYTQSSSRRRHIIHAHPDSEEARRVHAIEQGYEKPRPRGRPPRLLVMARMATECYVDTNP